MLPNSSPLTVFIFGDVLKSKSEQVMEQHDFFQGTELFPGGAEVKPSFLQKAAAALAKGSGYLPALHQGMSRLK